MNLFNTFREERLSNYRPFKGTIELTYQCNERCSHCYLENFKDDTNRTLSLIEWKKVLAELKSGGVLYLDLIGGEPMLHPHFWEILEEAVSLGFFTGIISNGLKIDETAADRFSDLGVSNITLSLYSLDENIHDKMTNVRGSHKKLMEAIFHLSESQVPFTLNCLLTKHNIESYFQLEDWARERNYRLMPDPYITAKTNGDPEPFKQRASLEQLQGYFKEKSRREKWKPFEQEMELEENICGAGRLKCAVDRYGDLLTCLEIRDPLGSLLSNRFSDLWYNKKANYWRNLKNKDLKSNSCTSGFSCDHCPGAAMQESGDELLVTKYSKNIQLAKNTALNEIRTNYE